MPFLSFKFSAEELADDKACHGVEFWEKNGGSAIAPTDGLLFQGKLGERVQNLTEARQHGITWIPDKMHSVLYAVADTFACVCCRIPWLGCSRGYNYCGLQLYAISFTRGQWLWAFNLFCFLVHQTMAYLTFTSCNGNRQPFTQERINPNCTVEAMSVPLYRLTSRWTNTTGDGYSMGTVSNGGDGVRFDLMTGWFFQLSAIFHSLWVVLGGFDRFNFLYWKQIDDAWCWWRWTEYAFSAPLMFFCLQLIVGLREVNTIALSWMLMAITMFFGLAQETWSRPARRDPDGYRGWVGDPPRTNEIMAIEEKRRSFRDRNYIRRPGGAKRYPYKQTLQNGTSAQRLNFEDYPESAPPPPLEPREIQLLRQYAMQYTYNYFYRMIPHFVGWFPYVAVWVVYFNHFGSQLSDLRREDEALFERVPDFVPYAVGGTAIFFTSFTFVQWRYQYISPDFYWKTEIIYCFLSATSKLFLGTLLYVNILAFASFDEGLNDSVDN
jgi:hypothetical protein